MHNPRIRRSNHQAHSGITAGLKKGSTTMAARKPIMKKKFIPVKTIYLGEIDYKDVTLLRKFISDRGKIRSRRVTGLTVQDQRKVAQAIKNAREVALLPYASSGR
jgi:small subunit ribosomal protein S18